MERQLKTTISREKLYERNYTRDSLKELYVEHDNTEISFRYKAIINILTKKYLETSNL